MRALRVIGLHEDGKSIVCEDPSGKERFLLPADERLRAAARGDITRLGQIEIELESQVRPREIQARVRAGETIEGIANSAGVPVQRIERYAHPVLLERARMAELAQRAHPVREDGPDVRPLGEVVAHTFGVRGQDYTQATWDAWRDDAGKWVIGLHWKAGRSDNQAHWAFLPGAHGGTVNALDELAEDLLNPNTHRTLRTLKAIAERPVTAQAEQQTFDSLDDEEQHVPTAPRERPVRDDEPMERTMELPRIPADGEFEYEDPAPRRKGKKGHPTVPSWEDVLLGVRTQRG